MQELGGFRIERALGKGATAQVYLASELQNPANQVALKVFHPGLWDHEDFRRRAQNEVKAVSSLQHPNIVGLIRPLWEENPPAVALEYVDGTSLEEFQRHLPYILPEVAALVMIEVLSALEHAHSQGVIHRDLKPANILVASSGKVLVSDFGLAKVNDISWVTLSGALIGSPDFMSPEQARGDVASARSDLFSAAAILYFLVTGTRPFTRHTPLLTLAAVSQGQYEPAHRRNPKLSGPLSSIIQKGLSVDPDSRFASAREFREALDRYLVSLGLDLEQFNFTSWKGSPTEVSLQALKTIARTLAEEAERHIAAGEWDPALETLSHLSLVAPESAAIPRLMERMEKSRTSSDRKRFLKWGAAGGFALLVMLASVTAWISGGESAPVQEITEAVAAPVPQVAKPVQPPPRPVPTTARPRPVSSVHFDVPEGVQVYWNGRKVNPKVPLRRQPVGRHTVKLTKEGAPEMIRTVRVREGEPTHIRVR